MLLPILGCLVEPDQNLDAFQPLFGLLQDGFLLDGGRRQQHHDHLRVHDLRPRDHGRVQLNRADVGNGDRDGQSDSFGRYGEESVVESPKDDLEQKFVSRVHSFDPDVCSWD